MKNQPSNADDKKLKAKKATTQPGEATFEDYKHYIKEMRSSFWKVLTLFALGAVIGMAYYKQILTFIMGFFKLENINLVLTSPYQFIDLAINSGFFVGIVFATPVFLYYALQFSKPALKEMEYKLLLRMIPASIVLFIMGFIFGVWVLQYVVDLFSQTSDNLDIGNIWDLSGFLSQVIVMGLSLAFIFQMPIVITSLLKLKIIKYKTIQGQRRAVYAGIVIFAALMPPTDIVALLILAIVPLFLFELTLFLNKMNH
jgi:sec-independent protein translocase protein TatC